MPADHSSQSWMWRSVPHKPALITRILTSPIPGLGSGTSRNSSPGPAWGFTSARIVPPHSQPNRVAFTPSSKRLSEPVRS